VIRSAYPTLSAFFAEFYRPRRLLDGSPLTLQQYAVTLRKFSAFLGRPAQITDLDEDRLTEFLSTLTGHLSACSVNSARKHLLALANFANRKGFLAEAPDVAKVRLPKRIPVAYTAEQIGQLLSACRDIKGLINGVPGTLFWSAAFLVLYDTGIRAGPLWLLTWGDWQPPSLLVRAETQKHKADQLLRVREQTAEAIEAIRQPPRDRIFDWPYSDRIKYVRIKRIFKSAGLPHGRRDLCQRIRRTTATLMHDAGADATTQLGHSSDRITREHYLDQSHTVQAADVLPEPTQRPRFRVVG
jgi:integrase